MVSVRSLTAVLLLVLSAAASAQSRADLERGRYLVLIGHCNNCHTAGYSAKEGDVPESAWLTGSAVGWRSAAGTTYPTNLRIYFQNLTEDAWLHAARNARMRPPMPWWSLRDTNDADLRAMYRYIRSLSPTGAPAPAFLPPDRMPTPPFVQLPMPPR
jgi:mono/diheme cytochrome c family protein